MKFISLFSGIGGFDLAFERAGMECVAVCEIDKNAQSVLRRHFPKAELLDDVRKVGKETHERKSVDLICGGFPCQDVSIAGKRAGIAGERSGLWFEFARIIDELEPNWVVIENVPGLLSSNNGKDFAVIIQWLAQRGYGVTWRVLDAQYFGVPQRRRRVFIVGSFGNGSAAEVLFEQESSARDFEKSREAGKDVAFSLRANPSHSGDKGDGGINTTLIPSRSIAQSLTSSNTQNNGGGGITDRSTPTLIVTEHEVAQTLTGGGNGHRGHQDGVNMTLLPVVMAHGQANAEIVSDGSPSLTTNHEAPILWEMQHASEAYRETSGSIAPTLQSRMGTGGNNVPLVGVRRLMPVECERLQGFPNGWTDGQADSLRYKQLGNAVAVPVVEWIGKRINAVTCLTPREPDGGKSGKK
jgi:DNA (cytosine-5)-methyltransferase 1